MKAFFEVTVPNLPFCLGPSHTPDNPSGIPATLDLKLKLNEKYMVIEQVVTAESRELLGEGYSHGIPMGTPSNDTLLGMPYVDDFIGFIEGSSHQKGNLLEIGAGTGYLSHQMKNRGWKVVSLEPGKGFQSDWLRFGLEVVNDFYPSKEITDTFDIIIMYTVLEHIEDIDGLLEAIRIQLTSKGKLILAVPDCTNEISEIDPAMLIHEHIRYFTETSLRNIFEQNGFDVQIKKSTHGRSIFACATKSESNHYQIDKSEERILDQYLRNIPRRIQELSNSICDISKSGQIAVYCPARLLNILPLQLDYIFIDDDEAIQGKFYPPFPSRVIGKEGIESIEAATLIIGSRTFGSLIKRNLPTKEWEIITIESLLHEDSLD